MSSRAGALFNAVKKQFGLHSYLLPLALPDPPPPPVPVPALVPRVPPLSSNDSAQPGPAGPNGDAEYSNADVTLNTLRLGETDIQRTARFTREFLVMSLLPWMEKCVVEWNENVCPSFLKFINFADCPSFPQHDGFHLVFSLQRVAFLVLPLHRPLRLIIRTIQSPVFALTHLPGRYRVRDPLPSLNNAAWLSSPP